MTENEQGQTEAFGSEHTEPHEGTREATPRVARSVSNQPLTEQRASAEKSTSARSIRRSAPRARRMNLSLTHINAWSVAKVTFMLAIAGAIINIIAAALVWLLLDAVGVFGRMTQIMSSTGLDAGSLDLQNILSFSTMLSAVTIISVIGVVLITLLVTIITLLYNVVSTLVGGVHITLGDD